MGAGLPRQGFTEEALPHLRESRSTVYRVRDSLTHYHILGEAFMQALRLLRRVKLSDDGLLVANENDERYQVAESHRLKGNRTWPRRMTSPGRKNAFRRPSRQRTRLQQSRAGNSVCT